MRFFILFISFILLSFNSYSQNILLEGFGNLAINTNVNSYTGYANQQGIGFEGTGLIRRSLPTSSGTYINASGSNYVLLRPTQFIKTKEINYQNQCEGDLLLFFGYFGNFNNIKVEYSFDNINFSTAFINQTKDTTTWRVIEGIIPYSTSLYLKFTNVGSTDIRIDDINLISPCPLPVELLYLKGYQNNFTNILEWETASEFNNDFFEIQRGDGDTKFYSIGKVKGNNIPSKYHFIDNRFDPSYSIFYYRFKQVDFDGSFEYSPIISIENNSVNEFKNIYLDLQGREITNIDDNPFYIKITIFNNGLIKSKKVYNFNN